MSDLTTWFLVSFFVYAPILFIVIAAIIGLALYCKDCIKVSNFKKIGTGQSRFTL